MGKAAGNDKEKGGKETVLKYLTGQNRPYSVNDLVANLHNEVPKTLMQKVLDTLVEDSKVKEKVNGKQKAYFVNQDDFPVASDADLQKLDQEIIAVQENLTQLLAKIKVKEEKIRAFASALTTKEAKEGITKTKKQVEVLEKKIKDLSNESANMVDQDTMNAAQSQQSHQVKEWRKRKRMFNGIADAILDGYPHPKKQFYEEVGVETDLDVNVKMPEI